MHPIKLICLLALEVIEMFQFFNKDLDPDDINDKFQDCAACTDDIRIVTDTGSSPIAFSSLTQRYDMYRVELENGYFIECADTHILFKEDFTQVFTADLKIGDKLVTDVGCVAVKSVTRMPYKVMMADISLADLNHRYYTNGILSHNTVMSGVFIAWFMLFNYDKNVLVVADNGTTTKEIIDKIKTIFENLPFFMKPGSITNSVMSLKFDNGCRMIGRSTTKKTGIGFTIHLLYIDEFAHINPAYLDHFYRSIYPTISASKRSKIIITSTPNGMNKFYEIYKAALEGANEYKALRVDWWQVEGRDENWKKDTIANMGSEEDFNQEFGLQFFSSDKLLLSSKELKKLFRGTASYTAPSIVLPEDKMVYIEDFTVHPKLANMTLEDFKSSKDMFVITVDTADGEQRDFTVFNVFKVAALPVQVLKKQLGSIKSEYDIVSLVQVATWRCNTKKPHEAAPALENLCFEVFNPERVRILIEMNHKGEYFKHFLEQNSNFWPGMLIHSKHTMNASSFRPGIKLSSAEMKIKVCERFKYFVTVSRILPNEFKTMRELGSFGRTRIGTYRCQTGNDDLATSTTSLSVVFDSPNFFEIADDVLDNLTPEYVKGLEDIGLREVVTDKRGYDWKSLKSLNKTPQLFRTPGTKSKIDVSKMGTYMDSIKRFYSE